MATFHTLKIHRIVKETKEAVSISFEIPEAIQEQYKFVAGQYVTLKSVINEQEVRRAYSICSSPSSNELKVAVKAIKNGVFSTFATSELTKGDTLEVSIPEGKFTLQPSNNKNYLAFACGSGITPVLSMIKSVLESENNASITLIYGNKSSEKTIFKSELELLDQNNANFKLHFVYSREQNDGAKFGRIDKGLTNYFVKNIYKNISFDAAFLCGPEEMIETVSNTLQENGFDKAQVLFELFTASINESVVELSEGKTEVTVLLDDETTSFVMDNTDDILAAALRNNIDAPYSCQGGVCSSCLGKLTDGKAVMKKNSILTDSEVAEGFVLTCQAHPTTKTITVDFDDV